MNLHCLEILGKLETDINELSIETDNYIKLSEIIIPKTISYLSEIKKFILDRGFSNQQEEILFFKELKPKILSKLIYYNSVYRIETKKPFGGSRILKKYYNNEQDKLKRYFDNNLDFYKYYRTSSTYLDYKYFVRNRFDIKLSLDNYYFETDLSFTTSHDFKVAKILANDLLQLYLEDQLIILNGKNGRENSQRNPNTKLTWTGSKVALTELLYALQTEGVFNNGTADLKIIAEHFEEMFNIDLGQYRRTFFEIRVRKDDRAKFLTSLKDKLVNRMNDSDETVY